MAQSGREDPQVIARAIKARQPMETEQEIEETWNLLERLFAAVSPTDDLLREVLEEVRGPDGSAAGNLNRIVDLLEQQISGRENTTSLPVGRVGTAAQNIPNNETGTALFESWAGEYAVGVQANEEISKQDTVVVVGQGNLIEQAQGTLSEVRNTPGQEIPRISPDQVANIQNQVYVQSGTALNPSVNLATFDGALAAGDEETVVQLESRSPDWTVDVKATGVTTHKADVDGDNEDESIINYHYQYKDTVGGGWEELPGSPTVFPWGDIANPMPLSEDGVVGDMYGFRIRFENRTDTTASSFSVEEDDITAILRGQVV